MDSYRKKIDRLQAELSDKQRLIAENQVTVGSHLLLNEPSLFTDGALAEQKAEADRIQAEIEAEQQLISRINSLVDRRQAMESQIETHQEEIESLEESVTPMYEDIGKHAFEVYKENPFVDQAYVDMFSELVKNQEDIRDIDQQLEQLERETEEKPFLDRMVAKGKVALLRNRRTTREQNTPRLLRKTGKAVAESNFVTVVDAPSLTSTLEPYQSVHTRIDEIRRQIADLEGERDAVDEELKETGADKRPTRRTGGIEQQIESLQQSLQQVHRTVGEIYGAGLKKDDTPVAAIAEAVERIRELEKECTATEKQIERLQAAIAVDEVSAKIEGFQKKVLTLEEKIAEQQQKIQEHQNQISEAEAEKSRLEKIRGPVDKL